LDTLRVTAAAAAEDSSRPSGNEVGYCREAHHSRSHLQDLWL